MKVFSLDSLRDDLRKSIPGSKSYSDQIDRALALAFRAHQGQQREHRDPNVPKIPYIAHPVGVAKLAAEFWNDDALPDSFEDVIAAALLHDVLEDSSVDLMELAGETSKRTADIVLALTKPRVSNALPREVRNQLFVEQISKAGSSVSYVKLCDAIHNLGRPETMPPSLLEKSVRKARQDYLPLANGQPSLRRPGERLQAQIAAAAAFADGENQGGSEVDASDLDELLAHFIKRSRGKVLEGHDVSGLLTLVPGVAFCCIGTFQELAAQKLQPMTTSWAAFARTVRTTAVVEAGELVLDPANGSRVATRQIGVDRILVAPLDESGDIETARFVFSGIHNKSIPPWLTPRIYLALVNVLTERLRAREGRELTDYAKTLSHFGLELDPRVAREHTLTQAQMLSIRELLEAGKFVQRNLMAALDYLIRAAAADIMIDHKEGRVKSAASILRKVRTRGLDSLAQVDDIVGARIVFVSRKARDRFLTAFQRDLEGSGGEMLQVAQADRSSVAIEDIVSSAGYKAKHIRLQVQAPFAAHPLISCEIQLRTVLEDAWARLSQFSYYKNRRLPAKRVAALLKDLARLRDEGDDRIARDL